MKKLIISLLFISSVISGCATQPPKAEDIKKVSKERLYDQSLYTPNQKRNIPVTITRDVGLLGVLATVFLKIDGQYVVWLMTSEEITIYLEEGGYVFEVFNPICAESPSCNQATDVTIKEKMNNSFRIVADDGFSIVRSKT